MRPASRIEFVRAHQRTDVTVARAHSPLRLLTPRGSGHAATAYVASLGGGLVDGDDLALSVRVGAGASAWVSTQGPTRVYRSPGGCSATTTAVVEEGALLALVPDPLACFAGARYRQLVDVTLAPTSRLVLLDVLGAGRVARGERWAMDHFSSTLRVRVGERVLVDETWLLDPAHGKVASRFGRFDAIASLALVGEGLAGERRTVEEALAAAGPPVAGAPLVETASRLGEHALLLRITAVTVEQLTRHVRARLAFLPSLLGADPWARRF